MNEPFVFDPSDTSKYRKISESAYELITPGYHPVQEPMSDRDTHFQGFAELLMSDLNTLGFDEDGYRSGEETQKIIARRAYDLVCHTINHLSSYAYDTATSGQELCDAIPDMTEFP